MCIRDSFISAVQVRVLHTGGMKIADTAIGAPPQLVQIAEHDRLCRTGLGARGDQVFLQPVIAERALPGDAIVVPAIDHTERTSRHAISAAIADIGPVSYTHLRAHETPEHLV